MKIQPCPSCGARYNAERLEDGATFRCRRCNTMVRVGEAVSPTGGLSLGLAVAGCMLVATTFLQASPGVGMRSDWPWERFDAEPWAARVTFVAWAFAGLWALFAALTPGRRVRASVALPLAALLAALCTSRNAGFGIDALDLPRLVALCALAAGLLLVPHPATSGTGRVLALLGGVTFLLWHVFRFEAAADGASAPVLENLARNLVAVVRGKADESVSSAMWEDLIPQWLLLAGAVFATLAGFGLRARKACTFGFLLVGAGLLLPAFVPLAHEVESISLASVRNGVLTAFVERGVAVFALGCAAITDLARAGTGAA
jgi:hypothetical protein